jgi:protein kinase
MQNILIDGFEQTEPNKDDTIQDNNITAKLGDLGIVMSPMKGLVQPIAYRAPEVYFRREISPAIDIWAWGLIYCQLLEAQASFHKFGMYDDILIQGPFWMKESHVQKSINNDFDLGAYDYYSGSKLPHRDHEQREGQHWEHLKNKGVPEQEIAFLKWVLNPVPTERPTAQEILDCGWLTPDTADGIATRTFQSPRAKNARKNSEPILHARKRSEPSLFTRFYTQATNQLSRKPRETPGPEPDEQAAKKPREAVGPDPDEQAAKKPRQSLETHQSGMSVNESILAGGPPVLDTQAASIAREEKQHVSRPSTPRSSTQRPSTFLNYGAFMR